MKKLLFRLWLGLQLGLVLLLVYLMLTGLRWQADPLAMLPATQQDPVRQAATDALAKLGQKRLLVLISTEQPEQLQRLSQAYANELRQDPAFDTVIAEFNDLATKTPSEQQAFTDELMRLRYSQLSQMDISLLQQIRDAEPAERRAAEAVFRRRAQQRLYNPFAGSLGRFVDDPVGLATAYQRQLQSGLLPENTRFRSDGLLAVQTSSTADAALIMLSAAASPLALHSQRQQMAALERARAAVLQLQPDALISLSGLLPHAAAAAKQARGEIRLLGGLSIVGVIVVLGWAFRSWKPLLLSHIAVASGLLSGLVLTALVFGHVHLLSLVFATSLVGVAIDYSLHFLGHQQAQQNSGSATLKRILPGISLGLLTSLVAYGSLAITGFPGLQQIAVFTCAGLSSAWLTVVAVFPYFTERPPKPRGGKWAAQWLAWRSQWPSFLQPALIVIVIAALLLIPLPKMDDDLRSQSSSPEALLLDEQRVRQALGNNNSAEYLLVRGKSAEAVLASEQLLLAELAAAEYSVARVTAMSQRFVILPEQNHRLLAQTIYRTDGLVAELMLNQGFENAVVERQLQQFADAAPALDEFQQTTAATVAQSRFAQRLQQWLQGPLGQRYQPFWLGQPAGEQGQFASLVLINNIDDSAALQQILDRLPAVERVNRVDELSGMLADFRQQGMTLLLLAAALAILLISLWLRPVNALRALLPAALALASTLALFSLLGLSWSLFNQLALLLVLGIAADYGIFMVSRPESAAATLTAVYRAAITTILAFGLLSFSATPALHSFGLTLVVGIAWAMLYAALLAPQRSNTSAKAI